MAFKKGQITNPTGKIKGTLNKTTKELKELFTGFLSDNYDKAVNDFNSLEPEKRVKYYLEFAKYVLPTAKDIDIKSNGEPIGFNIDKLTDDEINEVIAKLK